MPSRRFLQSLNKSALIVAQSHATAARSRGSCHCCASAGPYHREELPAFCTVFIIFCALQEHVVGEFIPVNCTTSVCINLHKELHDLLLCEILAQIRPQLLIELIDVELTRPIIISILHVLYLLKRGSEPKLPEKVSSQHTAPQTPFLAASAA